MILTDEQRMAADLGLDVDNPFGRAAVKNRQWPGGKLVYVIDSSLCKFITASVKFESFCNSNIYYNCFVRK